MKTLVAIAMGVVLLAPLSARAQDLANILGTVTDSTGAVVPDAQVTVLNSERGFTRTVTSNADGDFSVSRVPIGSYTISAEKPGFEKLVRSGITLNVGQTLRVPLQLRVGSISEEVDVSSTSDRVETETGAVSHVITSSQVGELNLESRNFATLATLVPGAAPAGTGFDPTSVGVLANATISFNGVPGNFNNWEVDSTNNVDQGSGSNSLMLYPSIDSIGEFRISTSNYSAEYGKSGGANIEVVTKSGTKDFHGDLFEFVRNDAFDANDWFLDEAGQPRNPLKRNNWGFTLGGPIYIPGHYNNDRTKTFFFVSEEWRSNREGTIVDQDVPSVRERSGDFSECDPASPNFNQRRLWGWPVRCSDQPQHECTLPKRCGSRGSDGYGSFECLDSFAECRSGTLHQSSQLAHQLPRRHVQGRPEFRRQSACVFPLHAGLLRSGFHPHALVRCQLRYGQIEMDKSRQISRTSHYADHQTGIAERGHSQLLR